MLADFYIPRLSNGMNMVVLKNDLGNFVQFEIRIFSNISPVPKILNTSSKFQNL